MIDSYKRLYIRCDCNDPDDMVIMEYDKEAPEEGMEFYYKLKYHLPWYKRIWVAIKYIFKFDEKYQFSELILHPDMVQEICEFTQEYERSFK